jgi:hypothetical protein
MSFRIKVSCLLGAIIIAAVAVACSSSHKSVPTASDPVKTVPAGSGAFNVEMAANSEIKPEEPIRFTFGVKDGSGKLISDLDIVHEKPMHMLVVSDDLAFFEHIHPNLGSDGRYSVETKFPSAGKYRFYLDYRPKGTSQQIERKEITVAGAPRPRIELVPDKENTKTFGNLRITMQPDKPIKAGEDIMLNFKVEDVQTGKPVTDLQPYLGALAHFVIISEDKTEFLHAHPMEKGMDHNDAGGKQHEHAAPRSGGPEVSAHTNFPKPGLYKVWAQFQRGGNVITSDFVINVEAGTPKAAPTSAKTEGGVQKIRVVIKQKGYEPESLQLKRGVPAEITFYRADANNCGEKLVFKELGIEKTLPVGQPVVVQFTPEQEGSYNFTCGMNMYRGTLNVAN